MDIPANKAFRWWIKLPGVTVQCPKCKHQMYVMAEYQVTGGKAIKVIEKVVRNHEQGRSEPREEPE
jgi:hypothetical protein